MASENSGVSSLILTPNMNIASLAKKEVAMIATMDKVYPIVKKMLADSIIIDETDIALTKSVVIDLGAESIDILDFIFRLEHEFKIKIPNGEIEKEVRQRLPDDAFEINGIITSAGMAELQKYLSEVPKERFKSPMKTSAIPALFTVETFCKLVINAINKRNL